MGCAGGKAGIPGHAPLLTQVGALFDSHQEVEMTQQQFVVVYEKAQHLVGTFSECSKKARELGAKAGVALRSSSTGGKRHPDRQAGLHRSGRW